MKFAQDIIKRPYITEKSNQDISEGKYTFVVDPKATKTEIRNAVEQLFNVKVLSVNTISLKGKIIRRGVHQGARPDWKKAIVKIDTDPAPQTYYTEKGKKVAVGKKYKTSIEEFGVTQ